MAKSRPKPVQFQVRPVTKGLNYAARPQLIDMRETPSAMNNRFTRGMLQSRAGFKHKYIGADETLLWIDAAYPEGGGVANLIAIGTEHLWYDDGSYNLCVADAYIGDGDGIAPLFSPALDPSLDVVSVDIGSGLYNFGGAHAGALYPAAGEYADIGVMCAGTGDGKFVYAYTAIGSNVEVERIDHADAPTSARCVAFFDQRLLAGGIIRGAGTDDYSMIQWSAQYTYHDWSTASGGGYTTVGDSPDWMQAMKRLGPNLIAYKERSIYIGRRTFLADPPFRFEPAPGQGIGLAAPNSVGDLGEEHIFLGWDDVYVFSLKGLVPIGTRIREELFYGDNGINPAYIHLSTGIIAEEFDEYWLFIPTGKWPDDDEGDAIPNLIVDPVFHEAGIQDTAQAGGAATITLAASSSAVNDYYNGATIRIMSNTGVGESRTISGYVGATKVATVSVAWGVQPDATSEYMIDRNVSNHEPTNWTASADGDGTVNIDVDGGGTFSPHACDMTRTTGTHVSVDQTYDYAEVIQGQKFSAVVWLSSPDDDVAYDIRLYTKDGAGGNPTVLVNNPSLTGTVSDADGVIRLVLSGTVNDADGEQIWIVIKAETASKTLELHGVHLVRIDNIDDSYITGVIGEQEVGYIQADNTVLGPPLIVDRIGGYLFDTVWCWNYEENAWSSWRLPMSGFGYDVLQPILTIASLEGTIEQQTWRYDEKRLVDLAPTNLLAQVDGRIYEASEDCTYDWEDTFDQSIMTYWESKDFDFDQPQMDKTFSRLVIFHDTDHAPVDVTVGVSTDSGVTYQEQVVTIRNGYTSTFADFFVTGPQLRFKVSVETPGFFINGFGVKIIPRGEINPY